MNKGEYTYNEYNDPELTITDWETKKQVYLDSFTEVMAYTILRFRYPEAKIHVHHVIPIELTDSIAYKAGLRPYANSMIPLTLTFKVDYAEGISEAIIVTDDLSYRKDKREMELMGFLKLACLEMNISFRIITRKDINRDEYLNILDVIRFYDEKSPSTYTDFLRHLIATQEVKVNMNTPLDYAIFMLDDKNNRDN